jgi:hypothetical protein
MNLEITEGYVIFETNLVKPKKKGDLPETVNIYLCGSEYNPYWSTDIREAYRVFDKEEAFLLAGGLAMLVGEVEIKIKQITKSSKKGV